VGVQVARRRGDLGEEGPNGSLVQQSRGAGRPPGVQKLMQVSQGRVLEHQHQPRRATPDCVARAIVAAANATSRVHRSAAPKVAQARHEMGMARQLGVQIELVRDGRAAA